MLFLLGNAIREARRRLKLTQSALAKATGIGRSTLSQIENGAVIDIGIRKIIRVLDYLGLELTTRPQGAPPTLEELRKDSDDELVKSPFSPPPAGGDEGKGE